jgi:hypothetical protein
MIEDFSPETKDKPRQVPIIEYNGGMFGDEADTVLSVLGTAFLWILLTFLI